MSYPDFEYYTFDGIVGGSVGIEIGTAVKFSGSSSSYPATIEVADDDDDQLTAAYPRTNYIGVTTCAGAVGDTVSIRPWSQGSVSARCYAPSGAAAGTLFKWDNTGAYFVVDATAAATAMCIGPITASSDPQLVELMVIKGGQK